MLRHPAFPMGLPHLRASRPSTTAGGSVDALNASTASLFGPVRGHDAHHPRGGMELTGSNEWTWGPSAWERIATDYSRSEEDRARARELVSNLRRPAETPAPSPFAYGGRPAMDGGSRPVMNIKPMTQEEIDSTMALIRRETGNRRRYGGMPFRGMLRQAATKE